ncbi:hypothetical protein I7I53_01745 [Histoplasma capsulatum var. duboisii H88]|uniref:Uncharacterized protein n=1 Tax=Ajellomyces capsulatus (strain H88) TaxID=544711 RepID=A0A8A1LJQ7_AJEC8|nr:hypothetical protein I7I53_01745 [Histoplasma capsulatum var. duboisii H88]
MFGRVLRFSEMFLIVELPSLVLLQPGGSSRPSSATSDPTHLESCNHSRWKRMNSESFCSA